MYLPRFHKPNADKLFVTAINITGIYITYKLFFLHIFVSKTFGVHLFFPYQVSNVKETCNNINIKYAKSVSNFFAIMFLIVANCNCKGLALSFL